jgi:hypothetical protein
MQKRMSGGTLTPAEQTMMRQVFAAFRPQSGGGGGGAGRQMRFGNPGADEGGSFIVFVLRDGKPTPLQIRTGLTDLDYVEVLSGLTEKDTVLVLPSASLINAQRDMRERMQRMTGGGLPGVQQQQPTTTTRQVPAGPR